MTDIKKITTTTTKTTGVHRNNNLDEAGTRQIVPIDLYDCSALIDKFDKLETSRVGQNWIGFYRAEIVIFWRWVEEWLAAGSMKQLGLLCPAVQPSARHLWVGPSPEVWWESRKGIDDNKSKDFVYPSCTQTSILLLETWWGRDLQRKHKISAFRSLTFPSSSVCWTNENRYTKEIAKPQIKRYRHMKMTNVVRVKTSDRISGRIAPQDDGRV